MITSFSRKVILPRLQVSYTSILKQFQKHQYVSEVLKLGGLVIMFLLTIGWYLYYINASSTLGYYLRQEEKILSNKRFEHNALVLERLQLQQQLWQKLSVETEDLSLTSDSSDLIRMRVPYESLQ